MAEFNNETAAVTGKAKAYVGDPQYGMMLELPVNFKKDLKLGIKKVAAVLLHLEEAKLFVAGKLPIEKREYTEKVRRFYDGN